MFFLILLWSLENDSEFDLEHQACEVAEKAMSELEVPFNRYESLISFLRCVQAQLTNKETAEDIRLVAYEL
ncbi:hypothetical protein L1887_28972 [Cichorium endivia]|nr:hypothetical protein L1887_28972 [Cichorium endivia]